MPPPKCNICTENFNEDTKFPMVLPCGHSLCQECVLRYLKNPSQRCFGCAGNHPGVTMNCLPKNYALLAANTPPDPDTSIPPSARQPPGMLQVMLKELDGTIYKLKVQSTDTVLKVKNIIKDQYGFDPAGTRLLYNGEVLQDNCTLASYGVRTGNTVQMLTTYHGGRLPCTHEGVNLGLRCQHSA